MKLRKIANVNVLQFFKQISHDFTEIFSVNSFQNIFKMLLKVPSVLFLSIVLYCLLPPFTTGKVQGSEGSLRDASSSLS